jgi:hypothetical protein
MVHGTSHGKCLNSPRCMLEHPLVHSKVFVLTVDVTQNISWYMSKCILGHLLVFSKVCDLTVNATQNIPWYMSQQSKMHFGTSPSTFQGICPDSQLNVEPFIEHPSAKSKMFLIHTYCTYCRVSTN